MKLDELQKLEKEREMLAGKIVRLAIHIALIFAVPVALALGIHFGFGIRLVYVLPVAVIISWVLVIRLYRKTDQKMRYLDQRIMELKKERTLE